MHLTTKERWILSEFQVARDRCERRGNERLLWHRKKTVFAEIDLLTQARDGSLRLIEVKSAAAMVWGTRLLSSRQLYRLARARELITEIFDRPVVMVLATVSPGASILAPEIRYFDLAPSG